MMRSSPGQLSIRRGLHRPGCRTSTPRTFGPRSRRPVTSWARSSTPTTTAARTCTPGSGRTDGSALAPGMEPARCPAVTSMPCSQPNMPSTYRRSTQSLLPIQRPPSFRGARDRSRATIETPEVHASRSANISSVKPCMAYTRWSAIETLTGRIPRPKPSSVTLSQLLSAPSQISVLPG